MKIPGANHLSKRLQLTPRDYVNPPEGFGWNGEVTFEAPLDGDQLSLAVARHQHVLVKAWRQRQRTGDAQNGAETARQLQCSRQTVSATATGHRWVCGPVALWMSACHHLESALGAVQPLEDAEEADHRSER